MVLNVSQFLLVVTSAKRTPNVTLAQKRYGIPIHRESHTFCRKGGKWDWILRKSRCSKHQEKSLVSKYEPSQYYLQPGVNRLRGYLGLCRASNMALNRKLS